MRKVVFSILFLFVALAASSEGWQYGDSPNNRAMLISDTEHFTGDYEKPTCMVLVIAETKLGLMLGCGIKGEFSEFDFRDGQRYAMVSFDGEEPRRWQVMWGDGALADRKWIFCFIDSAEIIDKLREANSIRITAPIKGAGVKAFYFYAFGDPLNL